MWDCMLRWSDVCEARLSSLARRSRKQSVVMDMSVGGRLIFGGVMGWFAFGMVQAWVGHFVSSITLP